jgi:hypothetical protein
VLLMLLCLFVWKGLKTGYNSNQMFVLLSEGRLAEAN